MILQYRCYLILVGMGMHRLGYDIGIVGKVGKNIFVMTEQVIYLTYVETNIPKYRDFFVLTRKTHFVKQSRLELSLSL
jgi:hypothetical protein